MKGDFSRITNLLTFDKNYSLLLMQQGRVQLDSDLNAQALIQMFHLQDLTRDLFEEHGGRRDSFAIQSGSANDFIFADGRYYINGMVCKNEYGQRTFYNQPDYSPPAEFSFQSGPKYLVYLHAWIRHITSVEDGYLREVALGGPDTATRLKNIWQVKVKELEVDVVDPKSDYGEFLDLIEVDRDREKGRLTAQAKRPDDEDDLCIVSPESRYRGAENQLYRVEIHRSGSAYTPNNPDNFATFKWSRENGSVVFPIREVNGDTVTLEHLGRDDRLGLNEGDWVEVVDDDYERANGANEFPVENLLRVEEINRDTMEVTLSADPQRGSDETKHPLLRRWDHAGEEANGGALNLIEDEWIELEDGVEIMFTSNTQEDPDAVPYVTRDWWWITARTETGDVEWPLNDSGEPLEIEPLDHGNCYAPLAIIEFNTDGTLASNDDLRRTFKQLWE